MKAKLPMMEIIIAAWLIMIEFLSIAVSGSI